MLSWALLLLGAPMEVGAWDVPEDCPSKAAFVEMVEAEARVVAELDGPPVLHADVTVQRRVRGWELRLRLVRDEQEDERRFDAQSCQAVVEAAALVVSMRIVEWTVSAESPPSRDAGMLPPPPPLPTVTEPEDPEPVGVPSTLPPPVPERARESKPQPRPRALELGGWAGVHGGLAFGVAPGVGGGIAVDGGVTGRGWRAGLAIQGMPARTRSHPNDPAVRGRFDVLTGAVSGCGAPRAGAFEFPICGRLVAGGLRGAGQGAVDRSEPAWGRWWGLGGSFGAAWHVTHRLAPTVAVEALAPLRRWTFSVGRVPGSLHETAVVAIRAWGGVEVHF